MPAEWVKQLYQEAITGSDCQIFNLIEQIPSNHAPLRHALMDWVKDFDFERVIDLIKQVSNEGKKTENLLRNPYSWDNNYSLVA
jgi:hypothetical protein